MADLNSKAIAAARRGGDADDVLSILKRETQEAVRRVAQQLRIPEKPRTGPEASAKYRLVCQAYDTRRERAEIFDSDLFAEPVWDMLLAMFREDLAARPISRVEVLKAASAPLTTASRWLAVMEQRDLGSETASGDAIELTPPAVAKLEAYIERLRSKSLMRGI